MDNLIDKKFEQLGVGALYRFEVLSDNDLSKMSINDFFNPLPLKAPLIFSVLSKISAFPKGVELTYKEIVTTNH